MLTLIFFAFLTLTVQASSYEQAKNALPDGPPPETFIVQREDARFLEPDSQAGRFDLNSKGLIFLLKNEPSPLRPIKDPYVEFDKTHDPPNGNVLYDNDPRIDRSFDNYKLRRNNRKRGPKRPAGNIGEKSVVLNYKRPKVYTYLGDLIKQGFEIIDPSTANQLKHRDTVEVSGDYIRYEPQGRNEKRNNLDKRRQSRRREERGNRLWNRRNRPERRNRFEERNRLESLPDRRDDSRRPDRRNENIRPNRRDDSRRQNRRNDNRRQERRNDNRRQERRHNNRRQDRRHENRRPDGRHDNRRPDWKNDNRREDIRLRQSTHSNSIFDGNDENDAFWRDANDDFFRKDW